MSAFSNLPPQAVLPLAAYPLDRLARDAARADQAVLRADLEPARDRGEVLSILAREFRLPHHAGRCLDSLRDSLTVMKPPADASEPGFVVILQHLPQTPQFDAGERTALLDVFRDAAEHFFDRRTAFRVFYSLSARGKAAAGD